MKKINKERGQSLVELAISLVLILLLISGTVEFGMAYFQYIQLYDAVQEGALYASINPANNSGITARVQGASNTPIDLSTLTPVISYVDNVDPAHPCEGEGIKVELTYNHKIFMPFIPQVLGTDTIPLRASVTDTILIPACPP